ncbi:MAG: hypothetical protein NC417_08070 [Candidatus Gastranaerophilales bacterium]|nr:hypothetical protein [Candidatus Gastranaerophilales bacterium]
MVWKKNGFSYVMWFFYVLLALGGLYIGAHGLCARVERSALSGGIVSSIALLVGGVLAISAPKINAALGGRRPGRNVCLQLEALFLVAVAIMAIVLNKWPMQSAAGEMSGNLYFQAALVEEGREIPQIAHGIVYLYVQILHLVLFLFGNKPLAAIVLQMVLYHMGILTLYAGVRRLSGMLPSAVMLFFVCQSSDIAKEAVTPSPQTLYLLCYGVAFWIVAGRVRSTGKSLFLNLAAGLAAAIVTYLDVTGVTLLLILAAGTLMKEGRTGEKWTEKLLPFIQSLAAAVVCFLLLAFLDARGSQKGVVEILSAWGRNYKLGAFHIPFAEFSDFGDGWDNVALILMCTGIFSFWCYKRWEKLSVWVPAALAIVASAAFSVFSGEVDGSLWLRLTVYILAGVGIAQYFGPAERFVHVSKKRAQDAQGSGSEGGKEGVPWTFVKLDSEEITDGYVEFAQRKQEEPSQEGKAVGEAGTDKGDIGKGGEEMKEEKEETEKEKKEDLQGGKEAGKGEPGKVVTVTVRGETKQVKLLDNPLPLPKQHEHKAMDYGLKEEPDLDDYDIAVADDDDFDAW